MTAWRGVAVVLAVGMAACGGGGRTTAGDEGPAGGAGAPGGGGWGPLAVVVGPPNGQEALIEGTLAVEDGCVTARESGALLVWPAEATTWDAEAGVVDYRPHDRAARLADGDPIALGGGFGDRAGVDWVAEPDPACGDGDRAFFVGALAELSDEPSDDGGAAEDQGPPVTAEELTAEPWVLAGDRSEGVVSLGFDPTGGLLLVDGSCAEGFDWELAGDRLRIDPPQGPVTLAACVRSRPGGHEVPGTSWPFGAGGGRVGRAVGDAETVGRPAGAPDQLEIRGGGHVTAFERVDRVGRIPTAADLLGTWTVDEVTVAFAADGSVELAAAGCRQSSTWVLDGGRLRIHHGASPWSAECQQELRRADDDPLDGASTVRIEDGALLLGGPMIVRQLTR